MTIILWIALAVAVAYIFAVSSLYRGKSKQAAKFYDNWKRACEENTERAINASKLRDTVGELNRTIAAKDRELDNLKGELANAKNLAMTWRERANRFKSAALKKNPEKPAEAKNEAPAKRKAKK